MCIAQILPEIKENLAKSKKIVSDLVFTLLFIFLGIYGMIYIAMNE